MEADRIFELQDTLIKKIINVHAPGLIKDVFFSDADPTASFRLLYDDIRSKTTDLTDYEVDTSWKIHAGACVVVAAKLVMAHDYISDDSFLFYIVAAFLVEKVEMYAKDTVGHMIVGQLIRMESEVLNKTIFNITPPSRNPVAK